MKKNIILKSITIGLFVIALFLNLKISLNNDNELSLNRNNLTKVASAAGESGDKYIEDFRGYDACCVDCWHFPPPIGNEQVTCECVQWITSCWLDPDGFDCQPDMFLEISNNCVPTGSGC